LCHYDVLARSVFNRLATTSKLGIVTVSVNVSLVADVVIVYTQVPTRELGLSTPIIFLYVPTAGGIDPLCCIKLKSNQCQVISGTEVYLPDNVTVPEEVVIVTPGSITLAVTLGISVELVIVITCVNGVL
jgi:hypothetical protein